VKLVSLKIANYRQFRETTTIEFGTGLSGLCGPNGVGKSKLIEAIGYALYGPNKFVLPRRDKAADIPSKTAGTPALSVSLVLELRGERYEIVRTRQRSFLGTARSDAMNVETPVSVDLWALIAPLLPPRPSHRQGGRPWLPDRCALAGIVFVLKTGCAWNALPRALGCGSGSTCWRRLRDWQAAGVWHALHRAILDRLGALGALDWSRVSVDSASLRAKKGAARWGRTRPIGANRGPSGTWPWIGRACHSSLA